MDRLRLSFHKARRSAARQPRSCFIARARSLRKTCAVRNASPTAVCRPCGATPNMLQSASSVKRRWAAGRKRLRPPADGGRDTSYPDSDSAGGTPSGAHSLRPAMRYRDRYGGRRSRRPLNSRGSNSRACGSSIPLRLSSRVTPCTVTAPVLLVTFSNASKES